MERTSFPTSTRRNENVQLDQQQPTPPVVLQQQPPPHVIQPEPVLVPSNFVVPEKKIHGGPDFEKWKQSGVLKAFLQYILSLNESIRGKKLSDACHVSKAVEEAIKILDQLDSWIDEIPPLQNNESRYGNKAFRTWYTKVENSQQTLMQALLPSELQNASTELGPYLLGSVGNYTRIDYGTGHEASFVWWMWALTRLGIFTVQDYQALVSKLFLRYILLMRKVQKTYLLEPAGSKGVWGLDDYQHLAFLFGSAQLIDHPHIKPKSIHVNEIVESYESEYLYLSCIKFIKQMKTGPFSEHSPTLDSISHVPHQLWWKVNNGLIEMYKREVMDKFVIVQHFLFGSVIPFE